MRLLENLCPKCRKEPIFQGLVRVRSKCPSCGYVYERESGYFLGAMVFSYFLGAFSLVPTVIVGIFAFHLEVFSVIAAAAIQLCILAPLLIRFSRLLWIHVDFKQDQSWMQR